MSGGDLTKLIIKCYKDETFQDEIKELEYTALLNPDKYSQIFKTEYKKEQGSGSSNTAPKFTRSPPPDLDLELLFDRTGVIAHYGKDENGDASEYVYKDYGTGISKDIEDFKKTVYAYNGDSHKPNYLWILWGDLNFQGVLTEMSFEYKLFRSDGTPLRAIAKVKFISVIEDNKRAAAENNSSPDLTHYRTAKAGDTLPLMTYDIYGDSKYYLEVAKANNIINFRTLQAGQKVFFPPIKKTS
ncbi:LysM peptidoglycan-binding domain-containing protein [Sungkyunkwania multivorans]|uniref:LysM peptidoglycan-binding domain-containing protein n=1 Tax=Sungkyunkwania multivorans TaxID=1173618 RepID=A0ABW3CX35_9FLAO